MVVGRNRRLSCPRGVAQRGTSRLSNAAGLVVAGRPFTDCPRSKPGFRDTQAELFGNVPEISRRRTEAECGHFVYVSTLS